VAIDVSHRAKTAVSTTSTGLRAATDSFSCGDVLRRFGADPHKAFDPQRFAAGRARARFSPLSTRKKSQEVPMENA
jgi:hypothetical protein